VVDCLLPATTPADEKGRRIQRCVLIKPVGIAAVTFDCVKQIVFSWDLDDTRLVQSGHRQGLRDDKAAFWVLMARWGVPDAEAGSGWIPTIRDRRRRWFTGWHGEELPGLDRQAATESLTRRIVVPMSPRAARRRQPCRSLPASWATPLWCGYGLATLGEGKMGISDKAARVPPNGWERAGA
jgi:hypothetical protein